MVQSCRSGEMETGGRGREKKRLGKIVERLKESNQRETKVEKKDREEKGMMSER